jgi:hypothetical protein
MVWKPGESGNPKGKKPGTLKEKPYRDALRMEVCTETPALNTSTTALIPRRVCIISSLSSVLL